MKILKRTGLVFLTIVLLANLTLVVTGKAYLYKGIWNTYLKGRSGPSADEYQIFENRIVKAGQPQPWSQHKLYNSGKIPEKFLKDFESLLPIAYVIVKDDSLIHEQYWNGYSDSSKTNSFSVAKTFVGLLVGIAIGEGSIKSVDQQIGDFLPQYRKTDITIRHLLSMSSGIDFDEHYSNPFAYPAQAYYGNDLRALTLGYRVKEKPGKIFRYLSGNTMVLAFILEKATGKKLSDYFSEKIWAPLGAEHDALWSLDSENGMEKAFCCFNSNARDFARIGQLSLDSGRWNGKQLIPEDYILESIRPAELNDNDGVKNDKYGYTWWLIPDHKGHSIFYARGILGQYIICIPDENMVIVRLGQKREKREGDNHPADLYWYIDAALEMYGSK